MKAIFSPRTQARMAVLGLVSFGMVLGLIAGPWVQNHSFEATASASMNRMLDSAAAGKKVGLATGLIDDGVEGLFALDYETGNLFCWIINPRNGQPMGQFTATVPTDMGLGVGGDNDYVLTTGRMLFQGGRGNNQRPVNCVAYVAEGNSGKVIGYSLSWNQAQANRNNGQVGNLVPFFSSTVRGALASRDQ